jgi:2-polyprenyl-3-methyl-5-hydroxy-6-metoxy-1,4-benzoquinol methylase
MTYASALTSVAPQDAFERWAALQAWSNDATNRLDETADLAFWERIADNYDAEALATRVPAIVERVRQLVPAGASILDVGAGTGAFTLPLAEHALRVTALTRILAAAPRRGIILWSVGRQPAPQPVGWWDRDSA